MMGKWLGVVVLLGGILIVCSAGIFGMCNYRLHRSNFSERELQVLKQETLVGRHSYKSVPIDYDKFAEKELTDRISLGAEIPKQMPREMILETLKTQISKDTESVAYGQFRPWKFTGLPKDSNRDFVSLRYRVYVEGKRKKDQRQTQAQWMLRIPDPEKGTSPFVSRPARIQGGVFSELHIPTEMISPDGELEIRYVNWDSFGETVVFQDVDGPTVMVGAVSFLNNYCRVTLLLFLQVMFMATLGCAAGACLSTPMAVFLSFSYVFVGLLVRYMTISSVGNVPQKSGNLLFQISNLVSTMVKHSTFTLNEYVQIGVLTDGRLIEGAALGMAVVAMLFARALPIMIIGLICFYRREFGLVVRK